MVVRSWLPGSSIFLVMLLSMVVGVVFVCGLYVGSAFMQEHDNADARLSFHPLRFSDTLAEGKKHLRGATNFNPVQVR
jgi:hypothetical protein